MSHLLLYKIITFLLISNFHVEINEYGQAFGESSAICRAVEGGQRLSVGRQHPSADVNVATYPIFDIGEHAVAHLPASAAEAVAAPRPFGPQGAVGESVFVKF